MQPLRLICRVGARLVFAGAFALPLAAAGVAAEDVELEGEIAAVDLSAMMLDGPAVVRVRTAAQGIVTIAVPSRGRNLCAARQRLAAPEKLNVGELVSVRGRRSEDGAIVPCEDASHAFRLVSRHSVPEQGFRFDYLKEPDGYVAVPVNVSESPAPVYAISLMARSDADTLADGAGPRESPKAVSLRVYRNAKHLHAPVWVERNRRLSSIDLATSAVEEAVLAGANAVRYRTDGLYQSEHIVAAHDGKIFHLTVTFDSRDEAIYRGFVEMAGTFEFTPPH